MSAFYVGFDHINALLTVADDIATSGRYRMPLPRSFDDVNASPRIVDQMSAIGAALLTENALSLEARYPHDWQTFFSDLPTDFRFTPDRAFLARCAGTIPAVAVKLAACLEYQSCEHDGWRDSYAKSFCEWITKRACEQMLGYADAPWGYTKPAARAA